MSLVETHRIDLADADTLETFYLSQTSTETAFLQLSAGPAVLNARSLDLGAVRVLQVEGEGRHLWEDGMRADEWRFALLVDADAGASMGRIDLHPALGHLLRPGEHAELLTTGRYRTLEITIDAGLAERFGWACGDGQLATVGAAVARSLRATVGSALGVFARIDGEAEPGWLEAYRDHWREVILDHLEQALQPWLAREAAEQYAAGWAGSGSLVRKARALLSDADFATGATMDDLAGKLGVSRRSLFLAFNKELGLGPRRFERLVRMNTLRARLYRADPTVATITELANDLGFSELGRLASQYRGLFGELPSATLRRTQ